MQWYLLKTWMGREEALVGEIQRNLPSHLYKECFVIYQERIWRKQQRSIVHTELLFPGCVFLICGDEVKFTDFIKNNLSSLKFSQFDTFSILPMMREDAKFLEKISGKEHLVRLSYVEKDTQGRICSFSKPLKLCEGEIVRIQFKKRYAMIHQRLWGEEQVLILGILLKEDVLQKLFYEKLGESYKRKDSFVEETGVAF